MTARGKYAPLQPSVYKSHLLQNSSIWHRYHSKNHFFAETAHSCKEKQLAVLKSLQSCCSFRTDTVKCQILGEPLISLPVYCCVQFWATRSRIKFRRSRTKFAPATVKMLLATQAASNTFFLAANKLTLNVYTNSNQQNISAFWCFYLNALVSWSVERKSRIISFAVILIPLEADSFMQKIHGRSHRTFLCQCFWIFKPLAK